MARSLVSRLLAGLLFTLAALLGVGFAHLGLGQSGGIALAQSGPPPVVLTSPTNNATGVSTILTFSWQASSGASLYNLYVFDPSLPAYSGSGFGNTSINIGVTGTSYAVPSGTFFAGHLYYWEVFPCTSSSSCSFTGATVWAFTTTGTGAAAPGLSTPSDASAGAGVTPTLTWTAPSGAISGTTQYTPVLYDPTANNNQGGFLPNLPATTSLSAAVPSGEGLQLGHSYQWTIDACTPGTGGNCSGPTTHWFSFTTSPNPGTVTLSSPAANASGVSTTATLSWSAAPNAVAGTTLYYAGFWNPYGPPAGHMLGLLAPTTGTTVAVPAAEGLFWGQGYYWSVTACTAWACSAPPWSPFSTAAQPAVTASGALPQQLANPDLSGQSTTGGVTTLPGWTVATSGGTPYSYTTLPLSLDFPTTTVTPAGSLYPSPSPYDTSCGSVGTVQSVAIFSLGYYYSSSSDTISVSYHGSTVFSDAATSSTPLNTPLSQLFAVPSSLSSGYPLVVTVAGATLTQVQRLDLAAPGSAPPGGLGGAVRFPKAVGATVGGVDVATGALQLAVTDLELPGVAGPLAFTRLYSQQGTPSSALGHWGSNWDARLTILGSAAVVSTPDGGSYRFTASGGAAGGSCSPTYQGVWVPQAGVDASLSPRQGRDSSGGTADVTQAQYVLSTVDGRHYTFSGTAGGSVYSLSQIADRSGNTQTVTSYYGLVTKVTDDASGRWLSMTYLGLGSGVAWLYQVSDSSGRTVTNTPHTEPTYGIPDDLASVTDVRGQVWHYSYGSGYSTGGGFGSNHWLSGVTDPLGHQVLSVAYDSAGHVQSLTDAAGKTLSYAWGSGMQAGTTTVTDQNAHTSTYYWDSAGRLTDAVDATGVRQSFAFDVDNNVITAVTSGGNGGSAITLSTAASYDRWGNRLTVVDGLGYTTSSSYQTTLDTTGNLVKNVALSATDPLNHTTTNTYDSAGRLLTVVDGVGHTVLTNTYNSHGQVLTSTNANNHTVTNGYSTSTGDRTSVTDALGKVTTTAFDTLGRPTSVTDPLGHVASTSYDAAGHVLTVTTHAGSSTLTTTSTYDDDGRQLTVQDANGHTTSTSYDVRGLPSTVTDANSGVTAYGYDNAGNRTSVQDANGKTTSYTFDFANRPLVITDPKSNALYTLAYDAVGRVHTRTDARGVVTAYSYDLDSQLLGLSYSGGGTSTPSVTYTYDAAGNRLTMQDGTGTTSYVYDADNRATSVTSPGSPSSKVVGYSYDNAGNRSSVTYPGGSNQATYSYDQDERLASVTDWQSHTTGYTYDDAGRLTATTLPSSTGVTSAFAYDESNRLTSVTHSKGGSTLFSASYTLDNAGNRTQQVTSGSAALASGTQSYTLDSLNRLTGASYPGSVSQTYSYDAVGNRQSLVVSGGSNPGTTSYAYDTQDPNRLTSVTPPGSSAISYGYDNQGNTTSRGSDSFSWDGANRLTSASIASQSFSASYNGDGLRASRTQGSTTTNFVWDAEHVPAGSKAALPLVLDDGASQYVYGIGLVARITSSGVFFSLSDGLGSVVVVVDGSGVVVQQYGYDVFGKTTQQSGSQGQDYQFAGQQTDGTGLQYLRARYYDPTSGRFLSRDPLSLTDPVGHNPFGYGGNNPVRNSDPSGLDFSAPDLSVFGAVGSASYAADRENQGRPNHPCYVAPCDAPLGGLITLYRAVGPAESTSIAMDPGGLFQIGPPNTYQEGKLFTTSFEEAVKMAQQLGSSEIVRVQIPSNQLYPENRRLRCWAPA